VSGPFCHWLSGGIGASGDRLITLQLIRDIACTDKGRRTDIGMAAARQS
jgi:hypothetical protein